MYIVLPEGTEITSVPDKDVNGNYVKPSDLADDDGLIWDSLFTRGPKGTGIAGSQTMGDYLTDIIESSTRVEIGFETPRTGQDAETDPNISFNGAIIVRIKNKPIAKKPIFLTQLTMDLTHELSHVHNFITYLIFSPENIYRNQAFYSFFLELMAYDRSARFAREMETGAEGNYVPGWYSNHSQFTAQELRAYGSGRYYRKLYKLAARAAGYYPQ